MICKKTVIIIGFIVIVTVTGIACILNLFSGIGVVPANISTYNDLYYLAKVIRKHYVENNEIAKEWTSIPLEYFHAGSSDFQDSWGNLILYTKFEDGMVSLRSFGSDGRKGGKGSKKDIVILFDPDDPKCLDNILGITEALRDDFVWKDKIYLGMKNDELVDSVGVPNLFSEETEDGNGIGILSKTNDSFKPNLNEFTTHYYFLKEGVKVKLRHGRLIQFIELPPDTVKEISKYFLDNDSQEKQ